MNYWQNLKPNANSNKGVNRIEQYIKRRVADSWLFLFIHNKSLNRLDSFLYGTDTWLTANKL